MDVDIERLVAEALSSGDWSLVLLALDDLFAEASPSMRFRSRHLSAVAQTLAKVRPQEKRDEQVQRLSDWLLLSTEQAAFAANAGTAQVVWNTQGDDRVRASHRHVHGAQVEAGQPFSVGEVQMLYPGQPIGDPSNWYNCRCYLTLATVTAALQPNDGDNDGAVVVLVPAEGDPIREVGPEDKHLTLVYVGDAALGEDVQAAIAGYAASLSESVTVPVTDLGLLGEQGEAQVAMLETDVPTQIRDGLLALLAEYGVEDASDWPQYTPHVTLGYIPEGEEPEVLQVPESVTFDRLEVWSDAGRTGWALGEDVAEADDDAEGGSLDDVAESMGPLMFHGIAVVEDVPTGDTNPSRKFLADSISWRELPLPLTYEHLEDGRATEVVGRIDRIWRLESDPSKIAYEGVWDDSPEAEQRIGQVATGMLRGVSVHVDSIDGMLSEDQSEATFSAARIGTIAIVPLPALQEAFITLGPYPQEPVSTVETGEPEVDVEAIEEDLVASADFPAWMADFKRGAGWVTDPVATRRLHRYWTQPGQPGYAKIGWGTPNDFYRCRQHLAKYINPIYLNRTCAEWHHDALGIWPGEHSAGGTMTASATLPEAYTPPLEWFEDPGFKGKTPLTITPEGRVMGHLASWDECHISYGEAAGRCVLAPRSASNYSYFRLGRVLTDGGEVNVGQIVLGGGHARDGLGLAHTQDYYASTSRAVADIAVGEDKYGVWFSGAVRPNISSDDLYALRAAKLSGDWRSVRGNLELVAALGVNVPGFPIPEPSLVASADGEVFSLTAAAIVIEPDEQAERAAALEASNVANAALVKSVAQSLQRMQAASAAKAEFRIMRARRAKAKIGAR